MAGPASSARSVSDGASAATSVSGSTDSPPAPAKNRPAAPAIATAPASPIQSIRRVEPFDARAAVGAASGSPTVRFTAPRSCGSLLAGSVGASPEIGDGDMACVAATPGDEIAMSIAPSAPSRMSASSASRISRPSRKRAAGSLDSARCTSSESGTGSSARSAPSGSGSVCSTAL